MRLFSRLTATAMWVRITTSNAVNSSSKFLTKVGNPLTAHAPHSIRSLASLTGTPCANANDGDPFALYDHQADRWVISDFAFPAFPGTSFLAMHRLCPRAPILSQVPGPSTRCKIDPANTNLLGDYPEVRDVERRRDAERLFLHGQLVYQSHNLCWRTVLLRSTAPSMLTGGPANAIGVHS